MTAGDEAANSTPAALASGSTSAALASRVSGEPVEGPFPIRQLRRLDRALRAADSSTGLAFSVYIGELAEPTREHAEKLHAQLADPPRAVLLAVSPNQRVIEIVTGGQARRRVPDRACRLAALSMSAAFGGGDLAGGIVAGLAQVAGQAGRSRR